ncbi:MAG TPA: hypothetical protein PKC40_00385 [Saprospiraceae bacterium]|nr:hypothetical protein [Saprospiraceae bacterium]
MKKTIVFAAIFFVAAGVFAQSSPKEKAEANLTELNNFFQLDEVQKSSAMSFLTKKYQDVEEIQDLKTADPEKYLHKRAILTEMYFKDVRLLLSEEQARLFSVWTKSRSDLKNDLFKQLQSSGVSQMDLRLQIAEID